MLCIMFECNSTKNIMVCSCGNAIDGTDISKMKAIIRNPFIFCVASI